MAVDQSDILLINVLDLGGVKDYQSLDKYLDQVYMLSFLVVALRWEPRPRNIAVGLYGFRMVGFIVFLAASAERETLLYFPNVFEFWFIFVAGVKFFRVDLAYTPLQVAISLVAVTALKVAQEYTLHHLRFFDQFTMLEVIEAIWEIVTWPFRRLLNVIT